MLTFAGACAAEEDNGVALVDLFARTCALRPALPSELDRIASGLGFVIEGPPISPKLEEMERGPRIDMVYPARLTRRGENVSLLAYFFGPPDGPTVSCEVSTVGVSAEALPGLIEKSLNPHDRTEKPTANQNQIQLSWLLGTAGGRATLEMSAWRVPPRRASISIMYGDHKR